MSTEKKQIKEGLFDKADKFVADFFNGLANNTANTIIAKAQKAKLPPAAIQNMKELEKQSEKFKDLLKKL